MKKSKKRFVIIVILGIGLIYFHNEKQKKEFNQLFLENVEALASPEEGTKPRCFYTGSLECLGQKVDYSTSVSLPLSNK